MKLLQTYKTLIYVALAILLIAFFFILGYSVSFTKQIKVSPYFFFYIFLLITSSVAIFIIFFKIYLKLIEKDSIIDELVAKLNFRQKEKQQQRDEAEANSQIADFAALAETIVPKNEKFTSSEKFGEAVFQHIGKFLEIVQGVVYLRAKESNEFQPIAKYAFYSNTTPPSFLEGETIPGQVAKDKAIVKINEIPETYFSVASGLGNAKPSYITYIPLVDNGVSLAVIEIATFKDIDNQTEQVLKHASDLLAKLIVKNKLQ